MTIFLTGRYFIAVIVVVFVAGYLLAQRSRP